jgi:hypothetical protein
MIKLYKQHGTMLHYWEAWIDDKQVATHQGIVGNRGDLKYVKPGLLSNHEKLIDKLSAKPRKDGFGQIEIEGHWMLTIQQQMTGDDNADLDHRNNLIEELDNMLGWIGSGHVDGGDIGSGTVNVFAYIVAPDQTSPVVLEWLRETGELTKSIVALDNPDESKPTSVIWPEDFEGQFNTLGS